MRILSVEHFIFRSSEFEQMEMEYFVRPGEGGKCLELQDVGQIAGDAFPGEPRAAGSQRLT